MNCDKHGSQENRWGFSECFECLEDKFEYLNKKKMPNQQMFMEKIATFLNGCPKEYSYAIEIRNPNFLNNPNFLKDHFTLEGI